MKTLARTRAVFGAAALCTTLLLGAAAAPAATAATPATASVPVCGNACFLDARTGAHTGYDRLVFDVASLPTLASVQASTTGAYNYTDEGPTKYPTIKGRNYLFLNFQQSSTQDTNGNPVYTTASPLNVNLTALKGVQIVQNFEGYLSFAISLDTYTSYKISTLTAPNRFVIDFYH